MWTAIDGQEVHLSPESIPDHTAKYIARDTLAAVKRFYENPSKTGQLLRNGAESAKRRRSRWNLTQSHASAHTKPEKS